MPGSNTEFCLTHRQDRAMGFPGNPALKVLPRMLSGTGSTDRDMFKHCSRVGNCRICTEIETGFCWAGGR